MGITSKILAAFFITTMLVVTSMLLLIQWSFDRGFLEYVNTFETRVHSRLIDNLKQEYREQNGWDKLRDNPRLWHEKMIRSFLDSQEGQQPVDNAYRPDGPVREHLDGQFRRPHKPGPGKGGNKLSARTALFDSGQNLVVGRLKVKDGVNYSEIVVDGKVVGYLGAVPAKILSDMHDVQFSRHLSRSFIFIAIIMVTVSLLLAWPLSRRLVRPISQLTAATRELASGRYKSRITIDTTDELGELSRDFNRLAYTLENNESARQQWIADISHELRTPISVLRGEIEAMQDGVRKVSAERLAALHREVMNLARLVDDLYELSMSDIGALNYHMEETDIIDQLGTCIENYREAFLNKDITLVYTPAQAAVRTVLADPERLNQLFSNVMSNSHRYTDPGGRVEITARSDDTEISISVADSAPGVADEDLERIFDRLYRVDPSRSRTTGGTGLGLAIAKNIIKAHEARIIAGHSAQGGLEITMVFQLVS